MALRNPGYVGSGAQAVESHRLPFVALALELDDTSIALRDPRVLLAQSFLMYPKGHPHLPKECQHGDHQQAGGAEDLYGGDDLFG